MERISVFILKSGKLWDKNFGRFILIIDLSSKIFLFLFGYFS